MRVNELARLLNVPNKVLLARLKAEGITIKSHSSMVDDAVALRYRIKAGVPPPPPTEKIGALLRPKAPAATKAPPAEAKPQPATAPATTATPPPAAAAPAKPAPTPAPPAKPLPAPPAKPVPAPPAKPVPPPPAKPAPTPPPPAKPVPAPIRPTPVPAPIRPTPAPTRPAPAPAPTRRPMPAPTRPTPVPAPTRRPTPAPAPTRPAPAPSKPTPPGIATPTQPRPATAAPKVVIVHGALVVRDLAEHLGLKPNQQIAELMNMNVLASINQRVDLKVAQQVAEKHGVLLEHERKGVESRPPLHRASDEPEDAERPEDLEPRPPVVTFLGHIDHGKTSLLDRIRNTAVAKGEAGGITQHVGAYTVEHQNHTVTFLDTPGHAAFTAMRARGANLTDIAVIVIAADDGIMPQTEEAIRHAQAAKTTILVAINKMDLPAANPDRVKQQLQALGLTPDDWGGTIICVPVSAATGAGIGHLLEMILLQAEMLELKARHKGKARGFVIEAQMEPGRGPTAHLLVTQGTLQVGNLVVSGPYWGRVKALVNSHGIQVRTAPPSTPVKCLGLCGIPQAGESFQVYANDRAARDVAERRTIEARAAQLSPPRKASLESLLDPSAPQRRLELRLIVKCDTQGSLEAIQKVLEEIKSDKVAIAIVLGGVGNITENDVLLASASDAIILGFHVGKEPGVIQAQKEEGIEIRLYSIIYQIADDIREAMSGLLAPELREKVIGRADVRQVFPISRKGNVAGCLIVNGRVNIRSKARVKRAGEVLYEGTILTLKRFQDEVHEVREGQECGIRLDNFGNVEVGDSLEFFEVEKIPQKL